ncbi:unnamed protein product [Effrenium voratum]|nr:unnamed protein product [Effrenium voratum]
MAQSVRRTTAVVCQVLLCRAMWRLLSPVLLSSALAGRLSAGHEETGKVPCACDNKVGVLAPKKELPYIRIPADARCERPHVHASKTGGKFCSCDKGVATNWKVALGDAQVQLEAVVKPKVEAIQAKIQALEEQYGITIDYSSISKIKPMVKSFPRRNGEGVWVCCCQSQKAGKCKENAQMEGSLFKSGFHHEAPTRACEEESDEAESSPPSPPSPRRGPPPPPPPMSTTGAPSTGTTVSPSGGGRADLMAQIRGAALTSTEAPSVPTPTPAASAPASGENPLMAAIRAGKGLKHVTDAPEPPIGPPPSGGHGSVMDELKAGVKLKPASERTLEPREQHLTPREELMSALKAGVQLKKAKDRKPEVETTRPPQNMLSLIRASPKFQALSALRESTGAEDEDDWDEEWDESH